MLMCFKLKTVFHLGARNVYHQLFMSSLLMDLKYKKLFAIQFARVSYLVTKCPKMGWYVFGKLEILVLVGSNPE